MAEDSFGNSTASDGRKKRLLLVTVAGIAAAAALLLGFVFTTAAVNSSNMAYAATDARGIEKKDIQREAAPLEDPPYLVSFSQAAATVEKAFPDSKINSGERLVIKTKSTPPYHPTDIDTGSSGMLGNDDRATTATPAYIFQLVKTDDKALYHMTVVVNGTSGEIIPPKDISQIQIVNGNGCYLTSHPYWPYPILVCPWGSYTGGPMPFIPASVE
ncbi:MAG TPA: hypothetical protein VNI77_02620 [Nitrososphaera sp.]|nr:hypothetical protein [Nitrososphaera sp.]